MTAPELPFEQRLAADLRALAQLAETHPPLGRELAHPVRQLTVVVPGGTGLTVDDWASPMATLGATELAAEHDPHWVARSWQLPHGLVTVTVTALRLES